MRGRDNIPCPVFYRGDNENHADKDIRGGNADNERYNIRGIWER